MNSSGTPVNLTFFVSINYIFLKLTVQTRTNFPIERDGTEPEPNETEPERNGNRTERYRKTV